MVTDDGVMEGFPRCQACDMWEMVKHPGVPTRLSDFGSVGSDTAIFVLGESPGWHEDQKNKSFVGATGKLLHMLLRTSGLHSIADIWLSNTLRCMKPYGATIKKGHINACGEHWRADLAALLPIYKRVIVLALGGVASQALGFHTVRAALKMQGQPISIDGVGDVVCFFTNHPAALMPGKTYGNRTTKGRNPSLIHAVGAHLDLLYRYLSGSAATPAAPITILRAPPPPKILPSMVTLDIETYGILKGKNQTVFHPVKSAIVDGVPASDQIVIVGLGYPGPDGSDISGIFVWSNPNDRLILRQWFARMARAHTTILAQNAPYDVSYLRYGDAVIRRFLTHTGPVLDDLQIWNHLDYEQRPEKSLKPLSELLGVGTYHDIISPRTEAGRASSAYDPTLWLYNAKDTTYPRRILAIFQDSIRKRYGPDTHKLSPVCTRFRHELLWCCIWMNENGVAFDVPKLARLYDRKSRWIQWITDRALSTCGLIICGKGSDGSKRDAIRTALSDHLNDPRVEYTQKQRKICVNDSNINTALFLLPKSDPRRRAVRFMQLYANTAYLINHYGNGLLHSNHGIINGPLCYPQWHPVPNITGKDDNSESDKEFGTIQGRITCSKPALQTDPAIIKACLSSRFRPGILVIADESQLELRIAGLLSGDEALLREFMSETGDPHGALAAAIFPDIPPDLNRKSAWWTVYRQVSKRVNFLTIYGGGPTKLQQSIRKDIGHLVDVDAMFPIPECERIIGMLRAYYPRYYEWHEEMIRSAGSLGYIETITGWSRTFSGGEPVVRSTFSNEAANCPIQMTSAHLVLSAQYAIQSAILYRGLSALVNANVYDAVRIEAPVEERQELLEIIEKPLTHPPLLDTLESELGRTVPLRYEVSIVESGAVAAQDDHGRG